MICTCEDYKTNMPVIDKSLLETGGYSGKWMEYCPWCGAHMIEAPLEPGQMSVILNRRHFGR